VTSVTSAGVVTGVGIGDADHHGELPRCERPNIYIQTVDSTDSGKSTRTDSAGNYSTSGVSPGPLALTASSVSYQTTTKTVTVSSDNADAVAPSCDLPAHRPNAALMRITQESANVLRPSFPQKP
jgi:hypothetical protein